MAERPALTAAQVEQLSRQINHELIARVRVKYNMDPQIEWNTDMQPVAVRLTWTQFCTLALSGPVT